MKKEKAFTLAEALIVLVIIGVIAALTVPAVLISTEQNEYKTAFKKAVSTINEAIQMSIALNGEGPDVAESIADPTNESSLFNMIKQRVSVVSTTTEYKGGTDTNYAFFTADGMRFEFPTGTPTIGGTTFAANQASCGNPDNGDTPCLIIVDVNGEKKPNPRTGGNQSYKVPDPTSSKSRFYDVYPVIVTDRNAYPFGVVAQRAFFQAD